MGDLFTYDTARIGSDEIAFNYLKYHIDRYVTYINTFRSASVVFLEIPPYSIQEWNNSRGHSDASSFIEEDRLLYERISYINDYIHQVNTTLGVRSPRFKSDLLRYRKTKRANSKRTSVNFSLYRDGIHPGEILARCWMKKIWTRMLTDCV